MRQNLALARWRASERTVGGWLSVANTHVAELMAHAGFDWLCVDLQHGLLDYTDLLHMLPAIATTDVTPLVRVASHDPAGIAKALDAGAMGIIAPLIDTAEQAAAIVSACRYPPDGTRSFGPLRAALYCGQDYAAEANSQIACIAMIETRAGLGNLEAILATPGLDGIYIGPADLGLALGLAALGDSDDPAHLAAVATIREACARQGVPVGIHTTSAAWAARRLADGFNFVTIGSDVGFMMRAIGEDLASVRQTAL
jgi:4-hydroxy-2-oxoheptanedioate aldolase